jgi:hypothetical protein
MPPKKETPLKKWITQHGGIVLVAKRLDVDTRTVGYWLQGYSTPRLTTLVKLMALSKGALTMNDILKSCGGVQG